MCLKKSFEDNCQSMITQKHLEELTYEVISTAIEVHKQIGRDLQE